MMPSYRIFWFAVLVLWGGLTLLSLPIPGTGISMAEWFSDADTWLIGHNISPTATAIFIGLVTGTVILPEAWRIVRLHLQAVEERGVAAIGLAQLSAQEIARYLVDNSVWAWRAYSSLYTRSQVVGAVSREMERAAKSGLVRFVGRPPESAQMEMIDRGYWQFARIRNDRLWDDHDHSQTDGIQPGVPSFFDLSAPGLDVFRTWPRASLLRKALVSIYVALRSTFARITEARDSF